MSEIPYLVSKTKAYGFKYVGHYDTKEDCHLVHYTTDFVSEGKCLYDQKIYTNNYVTGRKGFVVLTLKSKNKQTKRKISIF